MWIGRNNKSMHACSTRKSYPWANCTTTDFCASKILHAEQMFLVRSKLPSMVQSYKCNSWASLHILKLQQIPSSQKQLLS